MRCVDEDVKRVGDRTELPQRARMSVQKAMDMCVMWCGQIICVPCDAKVLNSTQLTEQYKTREQGFRVEIYVAIAYMAIFHNNVFGIGFGWQG